MNPLFILVTDHEGKPIWLNASVFVSLRGRVLADGRDMTVVKYADGNAYIYVRESPEHIMRAIVDAELAAAEAMEEFSRVDDPRRGRSVRKKGGAS